MGLLKEEGKNRGENSILMVDIQNNSEHLIQMPLFYNEISLPEFAEQKGLCLLFLL